MKKESGLTTGVSEPEAVNQYMKTFKHPLAEIVHYLRSSILAIDKNIGEGIYWNAPTFYFTGHMSPFIPKEYKRYLAGFVLNRPDCIRLVFLRGASANDASGLLEGDYKDGRRLVSFNNMEDVKKKEKALRAVIKKILKEIKTG